MRRVGPVSGMTNTGPILAADGTPFANVNPAANTPGSAVPAQVFNILLSELTHLVEHAGLTPSADDSDLQQVRKAIDAKIAAAVGSISVKQKSILVTAATFAPGVANGDPVRWDAANNRWAKALADGSANDMGLGIADVTNAEVTLYGETRAGLMAGLTPGARYYLTAAGGLSTTRANDAVMVGVAKSATALFVDFDPAPGRIRLTANLTLYVSTTGNDNNDGTSASPFATVQKAWDTLQRQYDLAGFSVTIQLAAGVYAAGAGCTSPIMGATGPGSVTIQGDTVTPANVVISSGVSTCFSVQNFAQVTIKGMRLTGAYGLFVGGGGVVNYGNLDFGAAAQDHIATNVSALVSAVGPYSISGGAINHINVARGEGVVSLNGYTVTLTGTPAFSGSFAHCQKGLVEVYGSTFTGTASGQRYNVNRNGVIDTNGGGASFLPGSVAGVYSIGGQYV